jgi:RNA polymerase sigma factor (sigma-70 family)
MLLGKAEAFEARGRCLAPVEAVHVRARGAGSDRADEASSAALHERYLEDVFHYVLRRVLRVDEAEDITAEVFAAAAAGLPRFRAECPPYLWLLSIARRQIARARRRRAARRESLASELADEAPEAASLWEQARSAAGGAVVEGPEAALIRAEARQMLAGLVSRLNPDQREALMLQYVEQLSVADIALVMGRSPGSVKGLLERAKASLYRHGRAYFSGEDEGQNS